MSEFRRTRTDYKASMRLARGARHHYFLMSLACLLAVVIFNVSSSPSKSPIDVATFYSDAPRALPVPPLPSSASDVTAASDAERRVMELVVQPGDSLAALFQRHGLSAQDLHEILKLGPAVSRLRRLHPGDVIEVSAEKNGQVIRLSTTAGSEQRLEVIRQEGGFLASEIELPVQRIIKVASNTIRTSLYQAGYDAGLSDKLIMDIASIFGWDIDFALDIREGDQFRIIYEELWRDGEKIADGSILAAEFINAGRRLGAVRFVDDEGQIAYYSPDGKAMRKTFLRAPLNFRYVSSGFNPRRLHPVLKRVRPHNGIDYAAPEGTPVYAAGDGRVVRSAYDRNNGHHVFLQHGSRYVTKYLHFSRRAVKTGDRVKQGQLIGYVGSTGLASGPHLHYEFLVDGVHRNPRTVELPDAAPIPDNYRERFVAMSQPLFRQLELLDPVIQIAAAP